MQLIIVNGYLLSVVAGGFVARCVVAIVIAVAAATSGEDRAAKDRADHRQKSKSLHPILHFQSSFLQDYRQFKPSARQMQIANHAPSDFDSRSLPKSSKRTRHFELEQSLSDRAFARDEVRL